MLSKAQNKYIRALTQQKIRNDHKVFVAEGDKIAREWLAGGMIIEQIVCTNEWHEQNINLIKRHKTAAVHVVKESELQSLSGLKTANEALLVVKQQHHTGIPMTNEWYMALDTIQDPGNMGTIIRTADWFGIKHIVCSPGCADAYNPKVVQSAMGAHLRVNLYVAELPPFLTSTTLPIYAATLNGENIYNTERQEAGVLIIGNESQGISGEVLQTATKQILIPRRGGAESLNAGVAAGIICALLLPR